MRCERFQALCILTVAVLQTVTVGAAEFRGLWVDGFGPGFFNAGEVKKLVEDCRRYNFNAVIVQMRRRADAFYNPHPPNTDPRTTIITTNFDALAEITKQCHTGSPRIEVHCWVVSHFIWAWEKPPRQPEHVFNQHSEFLTRDSIGQKIIGKGYFLDPGHPDANLTIYNMAKDIVSRYDIDGFHWDYCRYPSRDSGYNETAIRRYNEEFELSGQPAPDDPRFGEWRRRQVTDFLRWVNGDLWEIKPNLVISVAVFANVNDAFGYRFSDWASWNKEGIVDVCMPMDFSADNKQIFNPRVDEAWKREGVRHVYVGQAGYMNTKENTLTQLNYVRERGFPGTVLYSYRQPNSGTVDQAGMFAFLREKFQPTWTDTPTLPWKRNRGIIKGAITRKGSASAVYNATVSLAGDSVRTQKSEPHGRYSFFEVSPGSYTISAKATGLGTASAKVEVQAGAVVEAGLTLTP